MFDCECVGKHACGRTTFGRIGQSAGRGSPRREMAMPTSTTTDAGMSCRKAQRPPVQTTEEPKRGYPPCKVSGASPQCDSNTQTRGDHPHARGEQDAEKRIAGCPGPIQVGGRGSDIQESSARESSCQRHQDYNAATALRYTLSRSHGRRSDLDSSPWSNGQNQKSLSTSRFPRSFSLLGQSVNV